MKRFALLAATAVIAAASFGAGPSHAANTLGKRHQTSPSITSDSSPMTLFNNRGPYTSRAVTTPRTSGGLQTTPSGTPCKETYQPGPNGTLGGYTNPCTGAYRPAVN
ncbi:hypothetical protein [Azospirillum sp. TSO22-1]|uniref:hypothetical protein n=1 Tax=Azospirillum sp. TSO22-1 TaxID=716789 RepID=UPI000D61B1F3|nr:hypothetical protein [Azospirillum sp. TSO22-1]PWC54307.1 hypothetical protein TSO221_08665 [Azospirillum sp. TSO22-1]